jgi:antitoxin MazE
MQTKVQKWGNSLALRIPKSFATEIGLLNDSLVEVALIDGKLVIAPIAAPTYVLDDLLAGITDDNLHTEMLVDESVGNERW